MEKKCENQYLGEEKVSKLLLKFSIPCVLSLLISALYNIVDQIFIGNSGLGYLGNAATSVVFPITIISLALAWCFGDGAAARLSLLQGTCDTKKSHQVVGNALLATFFASLLFVGFSYFFMDGILSSFGATKATIELAKDYFTVILAAIPIFMLTNTMTPLIRVDGSPGYSMIVMLTGCLINLILVPVFIFRLNYGIQGAALATIIGQWASFMLATAYFFRSKTFKLSFRSFFPRMRIVGGIASLGTSTFIAQMSIVVISLVCNLMLVKYGQESIYGSDIPIAVIGISMKVFTIVIDLVIGIMLGAQPILGYNFGAKKYGRVRETLSWAAACTLVVGLLSTLAFQFLTQQIIHIFGDQTVLYHEFAHLSFRIFLSLILATCLIKVSSIFFQAVGLPAKAALISLTRDLVVFIPLVIILPQFFGIKGLLFAAPAADAVGILLTLYLVRNFLSSLDKQVRRFSKTL